MATMRIDVLAYEGCMGMEVFGVCDTLLLANRCAQAIDAAAPALFDVAVTSRSGATVRAAGGLQIGTRKPRRKADLLVVPGLDFGERHGYPSRLAALSLEAAHIGRSFARGTRVAAVCVGAFLLGEAGILDGRKATTAWLFAPDLARRFPLARLETSAMLVDDGGVLTTGAFSAAFDLAMHLIRQTAGAAVASAVARLGLIEERASQAAFVDPRMLAPAPQRFAEQVRAWQLSRLAEPYDLARLAAAFHVSARTLLRRVRSETGASPLAMLQQARVEAAKVLLESTGASVAQVTERVGYADVATFSQLFRRLVDMSPAAYRRSVRTQARRAQIPGFAAN